MLMVSNALSTAFGGLLALAIAGIKSSNGYVAWRWLFIVEGCFTCGVTILVYFLLSDWPTSEKWLKSEDLEVLQQKSRSTLTIRLSLSANTSLVKGQGLVGRMDRLDPKAIIRTLSDWKIYVSQVLNSYTRISESSTY